MKKLFLTIGFVLISSLSFASQVRLEVTWNYDLTTPTLTGFKIYVSQDGVNKEVFDVPSKVNSSIIDIMLEQSKLYTFTMTAYSDTGMESEHSAPYSVVELPSPGLGSVKKAKK